jgi:putative PIG3 family NAD(P)H quinone oxidoreductase
MRAITVSDDGSMSWAEVPDPAIGPEDVLLNVHATAVNRADLLQRRGLYPPPPGAPPWMGLEASGVIARVGAEAGPWTAGQEACALLPGGGYAERAAVHRDLLLPIPRGLTLVEAAALPEVFATAWLNLFLEAKLAAGETALIFAGASGVGTAAIQLARDRGARVATTVGSEEKAGRVRELGAEIVIRRDRDDLAATIRGIPGGVDVVLDCVGGETLGECFPLLNEGGRWVVIGLMGGRSVPLDLRPLLSRRLRLIGSALRSRSVAEKGRILASLRQEVWPRLEAGAVKPIVHAVLPITEAAKAHQILERNENMGKVVLTVV